MAAALPALPALADPTGYEGQPRGQSNGGGSTNGPPPGAGQANPGCSSPGGS